MNTCWKGVLSHAIANYAFMLFKVWFLLRIYIYSIPDSPDMPIVMQIPFFNTVIPIVFLFPENEKIFTCIIL